MSRGRLYRTVAAIALALTLSGCSFDGLNQFRLPGTEGRGEGAYTVHLQMRDVTGLNQNDHVLVNNTDVGTVTGMRVQDRHAVVTVQLNGDVRLPRNATARIGQTTVLGSKHIELGPPVAAAPVGVLRDGDTIGLPDTAGFPETEDVLASLSLLLNGGGLNQVRTITTELDATLSGRTTDIHDLLGRLDTFVGGLDAQKTDIVAAIDGLDRLSARLKARDKVLGSAIGRLEPALVTLNDNRDQLIDTLRALGRFGDVATRVLDDSHRNLVRDVADLEPTLRALADAGRALPDSLQLAATVPFPLGTFRNAVRGDFANVRVTMDLTLPTLDHNFLSGTPAQGSLSSLHGLLRPPLGLTQPLPSLSAPGGPKPSRNPLLGNPAPLFGSREAGR